MDNEVIKIFSEMVIPGDKDREYPRGSKADLIHFVEKFGKSELISQFNNIIRDLSLKTHKRESSELSKDEIRGLILKMKVKHFRLINELTILLCESYYSDRQIRAKIGLTTDSPFPNGNNSSEIDYLLLESVFEKGKIYRDI